MPHAAEQHAIREITAPELPALLALYRHLHNEPPPAFEALRQVWAEALANPRCRYFGGYAGDTLVASCTIMIIPNLTRGGRPYALIENVVTEVEHRRQGWGAALLAHVLRFAWAQGCYKAMLMTGRKDEATLRFYESAGFDRREKQAFVARPAA